MSEIKLTKDWKWVKLGEVAEITSSKRIFQHEYVTNGIPFYRTKEIKELSEGKNLTFDLFISNEKYNEIKSRFTIPKKGDVLLSAVGTIGISYIIKDDKPFYFKDGNLMWLRNLRGLDSKYLSYGLTNFIRNKKGAKISGSAYSALTIETIKNFDFPLPPLQTQTLIVSKIEELFSELDKGIEDLKTAQQQLKTYRQSVLKYAFEGKLTNKKVKEGELPKGWEWTNFEKVCVKIGDIDHKMPKQLETGYPYVSTKDFTNDLRISFDKAKFISKEDYLNLSRKIKPEKGDIIFPRYGTIGKNILIDFDKEFLVSYSCAVVKPNHNIILSKYIYLYSLSPKITDEIRKYVVETTQANIGIASIKSFVFPLPPMEEQQLIVQEIESRLSVADKMEESIVQSLLQAEALRQSILKKAFSGELVKEVIQEKIHKPKNDYFFQMQLIGKIAAISKRNKIEHGEMTIAKYAYLSDKLFDIPTGFEFNRWHLGPYPPAIKKVVNNKQYFQRIGNHIEVINEQTLFKSTNDFSTSIDDAISNLVSLFSTYKTSTERSHKTELLATVCKVIEDIKTTDLKLVRASMKEWKIILKTSSFKNKAEKFNEEETKNCIEFIAKKGWDKKLIK